MTVAMAIIQPQTTVVVAVAVHLLWELTALLLLAVAAVMALHLLFLDRLLLMQAAAVAALTKVVPLEQVEQAGVLQVQLMMPLQVQQPLTQAEVVGVVEQPSLLPMAQAAQAAPAS